jgi:hypothetical protein
MSTPFNLFASLPNFYQLAYVTADLDAAIAHFQKKHGAGRFLVLDKIEFKDATYRGKAEGWVSRVAQTQIGDMNIELIEPDSGAAVEEVFRPFVHVDRIVNLNHIAITVGESRDDWQAIEAGLAEQGYPFIISGEVPGMGTLGYVDTVAELGHYVELNFLPEDALAFTAKLGREDQSLQSMGHWV